MPSIRYGAKLPPDSVALAYIESNNITSENTVLVLPGPGFSYSSTEKVMWPDESGLLVDEHGTADINDPNAIVTDCIVDGVPLYYAHTLKYKLYIESDVPDHGIVNLPDVRVNTSTNEGQYIPFKWQLRVEATGIPNVYTGYIYLSSNKIRHYTVTYTGYDPISARLIPNVTEPMYPERALQPRSIQELLLGGVGVYMAGGSLPGTVRCYVRDKLHIDDRKPEIFRWHIRCEVRDLGGNLIVTAYSPLKLGYIYSDPSGGAVTVCASRAKDFVEPYIPSYILQSPSAYELKYTAIAYGRVDIYTKPDGMGPVIARLSYRDTGTLDSGSKVVRAINPEVTGTLFISSSLPAHSLQMNTGSAPVPPEQVTTSQGWTAAEYDNGVAFFYGTTSGQLKVTVLSNGTFTTPAVMTFTNQPQGFSGTSFDASVIKIGNTWHMWAVVSGAIYHATSTNMINWHFDSSPAITVDSYAVSNIRSPAVVTSGGRLIMFYIANDQQGSSNIYEAEADGPSKVWVKNGPPIITASSLTNGPLGPGQHTPTCIKAVKIYDRFYLFFNDYNGSVTKISYASTTNLSEFQYTQTSLSGTNAVPLVSGAKIHIYYSASGTLSLATVTVASSAVTYTIPEDSSTSFEVDGSTVGSTWYVLPRDILDPIDIHVTKSNGSPSYISGLPGGSSSDTCTVTLSVSVPLLYIAREYRMRCGLPGIQVSIDSDLERDKPWHLSISGTSFMKQIDSYTAYLYVYPQFYDDAFDPTYGLPMVRKERVLQVDATGRAILIDDDNVCPNANSIKVTVGGSHVQVALYDPVTKTAILASQVQPGAAATVSYLTRKECSTFAGYFKDNEFRALDLNPRLGHFFYSEQDGQAIPSLYLSDKVVYVYARPYATVSRIKRIAEPLSLDANNSAVLSFPVYGNLAVVKSTSPTGEPETSGFTYSNGKITIQSPVPNATYTAMYDAVMPTYNIVPGTVNDSPVVFSLTPIDAQSDPTAVLLAEVYVRMSIATEDIDVYDLRERGGGVADEQALLDPLSALVYDISWPDGYPVQAQGVVLVVLPKAIIKDYGGIYTLEEVRAALYEHIPFGTMVIPRFV